MAHSSEEIRCFIAIELPEEVKSALVRVKSELARVEHAFVKWVDVGGIHLTLKFLGNVYSKRVTEITEVIAGARRGISPFQLEVSGLGAFPSLKQPRVIWVGISGEIGQLLELQRSIDSAFVPLGFALEGRPFTPHLTLARVKQGVTSVQLNSLGQLIESTEFPEGCSFKVGAVNLMRSQLTPRGAIHTCLSSVELVR